MADSTDFEQLKVVELRKLCKEQGLDASGKKSELIAKLQENEVESSGEGDAPLNGNNKEDSTEDHKVNEAGDKEENGQNGDKAIDANDDESTSNENEELMTPEPAKDTAASENALTEEKQDEVTATTVQESTAENDSFVSMTDSNNSEVKDNEPEPEEVDTDKTESIDATQEPKSEETTEKPTNEDEETAMETDKVEEADEATPEDEAEKEEDAKSEDTAEKADEATPKDEAEKEEDAKSEDAAEKADEATPKDEAEKEEDAKSEDAAEKADEATPDDEAEKKEDAKSEDAAEKAEETTPKDAAEKKEDAKPEDEVKKPEETNEADTNSQKSEDEECMEVEAPPKEGPEPELVDIADEEEKEKEEQKKRESTPLFKYWKAVRDNPTDFTGWTYLLQYVEQEGKIEDGREAFNTFLARYPYCYGYWKKYADFEKKHKNMDVAEQVFERGLRAIPLSIDLWSHYITFYYTKVDEKDPQRSQKIRKLYERAIAAAGTDFKSDKLWESYIAWETDNKHPAKVTAIYDRLLGIPTYLYNHHFEKFKSHIKTHKPMEVLSLDEFLKLRMEHVKSKTPVEETTETAEPEEEEGPPGADGEAPPGADDDAPPGSEAPKTIDPAPKLDDDLPPGEELATEKDKKKSDEDEDEVLKERIIEIRQVLFSKNEEECAKRWYFEEGIRRPYFHVKPLERVQLKNWRDYLDFEMESGTHERVVVLFERCLIACALYEEFWIKYARYLESFFTEGVHNVYERGCTVHLIKKPLLHLNWAAFEERQGDVKLARKILDDIDVLVPGLAMVTMRKVSLERRQCDFSAVEDIYKQKLETNNKEQRSFYTIKFSRYLTKVIGNTDRAQTILQEALKDDPTNHKLHLQLLDTEFQKPHPEETDMVKILNGALESSMEEEHKIMFSQRKLEFLEDFGSNVKRIMEAYEDHQKLLRDSQSKKRKNNEKEDEPSSKKAKTEPTAAAVTPAASHTPAPQQQYHQQQHQQQQHYGQQQHGVDANTQAWQQWWAQNGQNYNYQNQASQAQAWAAYQSAGGGSWGSYNH